MRLQFNHWIAVLIACSLIGVVVRFSLSFRQAASSHTPTQTVSLTPYVDTKFNFTIELPTQAIQSATCGRQNAKGFYEYFVDNDSSMMTVIDGASEAYLTTKETLQLGGMQNDNTNSTLSYQSCEKVSNSTDVLTASKFFSQSTNSSNGIKYVKIYFASVANLEDLNKFVQKASACELDGPDEASRITHTAYPGTDNVAINQAYKNQCTNTYVKYSATKERAAVWTVDRDGSFIVPNGSQIQDQSISDSFRFN